LINKIKNIANTEDNKRLLLNFISLSILQGANYILPLITLPYLVRVLGVEYFGLLAFAAATIAYFGIITDYGFNLTATREISIHRHDKEKIIEIFSSVMTIKIILMFISFFLLSVLVFNFEKFSKDTLVYFLTFGTVIGQVFFPVWFFQGMEKMKYITYLNLFAKLVFTISIFIFVKNEEDFWKVPLLNSLGFIIVGIYSLYFIIHNFKIKLKIPSFNILKIYLKKGSQVFLQQLYVKIYNNFNLIFLGFFTNNTIVGYYSIAEKIIFIPLSIFNVFVQAYYPYSVKLFKKNVAKYFSQINKIYFLFLVLSITLIILIFTFSDYILDIIIGNTYPMMVKKILDILAISIIFYSFGHFYTQIFVTLNKMKILNRISFIIMIINLLFVPIIIYFSGVIGLAYFVVFRQGLIFILCWYNIEKLKKSFLKG
jgi:PST family polysaccharide transporter